MDEQRRVNLVLAELRDDGDEATRKFIEEMSAAFKLEPAKVLKVLENLPFVLSRGCTLDEARALAEKVHHAGGVCRMQEAQSIAPAPQQEEDEAAGSASEAEEQPEPAAENNFGSDMEEPPPASLVGEAKVGTPAPKPAPAPAAEEPPAESPTIPLATGGGGRGGGAATTSSGTGGVKCIECGEVQPAGPACRNCSFPLPEK